MFQTMERNGVLRVESNLSLDPCPSVGSILYIFGAERMGQLNTKEGINGYHFQSGGYTPKSP